MPGFIDKGRGAGYNTNKIKGKKNGRVETFMTNTEVYRKTLKFSTRIFLWDTLAFLVLAGCAAGGFFGAEKLWDKGLIGLGGGLLIGIVIIVIMLRYVSFTYKAAQIAMMTRGVTEDALPDDVIGEGKKAVRERFTTVALYFAATSLIKGIFRQIGHGITKLGESIGGDTGNAVGSAISGAISVVVAYLCDCCLGWIFFRKDEKAGRATLQGAALFFKHGKTFIKNMGRVAAVGTVSLLAIGGAFFAIAYVICLQFPDAFRSLAGEITNAFANGSATSKSAWLQDILKNPTTLTIFVAVVVALFFWRVIHSTLVRPFVLVGVLRNYIQSGIEDMPTEQSYEAVAKISPKFRKLQAEV